MKVKNHRRRHGALRFPVAFLIHKCRWGCNSSTSSRSSDVIRDSLLESLSQESSFQDTADLLAENNVTDNRQSQTEQCNARLEINANNRLNDYGGNADAELLVGANSGGERDSDEENESGAASADPMNPLGFSDHTSNSTPSPKDTCSNSSSRPRRRTLQEVFQIDIQRELQRQPLTEVRENRGHPLYNFNHNFLPMRRLNDNSLAVQVNPLFNLNERLSRNNLCGPSSLIAHFMQSNHTDSEELDSSSLRLGDDDTDIFRSEGQNFDSLPRDLPNDHPRFANANVRTSNSSSDSVNNSTNQTSLSSALVDNYSASLENVRFDFPHRMMALPSSGWLNNRISRGGVSHRPRPRRQISSESLTADGSSRIGSPNVANYEINPISIPNNDPQDTNTNRSNNGSRSGSRSSQNSSHSSGSNRVPTTQNWYFYDPRLLPGNRNNRVTVESNFRGVNTQFDVPSILSPPAYDEIIQIDQANQGIGPPLDPPPPYSSGSSDNGRPISTNPSIEGEPPPAYEQSFHHQLGEFSNFPREVDLDDDNDIDSELSDSLSSSVQLDDDDIPTDGPCRAIRDNFVLVGGSPNRQNQNATEERGMISTFSTNHRHDAPFSLSTPSLIGTRLMSTRTPTEVNNDRPYDERRNNENVLGQGNAENEHEDRSDDAVVREFFSPPITARSVFGGRPALRWSRNTTINRWMNTTQPWQL